MMLRPVSIRGITYPSQTAAAQALGVSCATISLAAKRGTLDAVGTRGKYKPVMIRGIGYASMRDAAKELGVTAGHVSQAAKAGTLDAVGTRARTSGARPITIRGVKFGSRREAAEAIGVPISDINIYVRVLREAEKIYQQRYKASHRPSPRPEPQSDEDLPPLGVMRFSEDGTKVQCHECGRWMRALNNHMRMHGLDGHSYKDRFGLPRTASLWPPAIKAKQREAALARGQGDIGRQHLPHDGSGRPPGQKARLGVRIAASEARKGIYTRGGNKTRSTANDPA